MRVPWLPDVLRAAGLDVVELSGWRGRGRAMRAVHGVVCHHTATGPAVSDQRVDQILRDGHGSLPGPLAQLGLDRRGRFRLIADGRCNHNGHGLWGNDSIGIEAYNDGRGEPWPAPQIDAYVRGTAAILARLGYSADRALAHRETDPDRKIDPAGIDMPTFRTRVAQHLKGTVMTPEQEQKLDQALTLARAAADTAARIEQALEVPQGRGPLGRRLEQLHAKSNAQWKALAEHLGIGS